MPKSVAVLKALQGELKFVVVVVVVVVVGMETAALLPVSTMLLCVEERDCYGNDWRRVGWELACPVLLH